MRHETNSGEVRFNLFQKLNKHVDLKKSNPVKEHKTGTISGHQRSKSDTPDTTKKCTVTLASKYLLQKLLSVQTSMVAENLPIFRYCSNNIQTGRRESKKSTVTNNNNIFFNQSGDGMTFSLLKAAFSNSSLLFG